MKKKQFFNDTVGAWIQLDSTSILKLIDNKKFNWVCFDLEHGCTDLRDISKYINVMGSSKKKKLIRINVSEKNIIPYFLDQGIDGIIIANISKVSEIKQIYELSNYPPIGRRGLGFSNSNNFNFKKIKLKKKPYLIPIIENKSALKNIEEICSLKIIDGIFIGPVDLSMSLLGKIDFNNSIFRNCVKKILTVSKKHNILCGSHLIDDDIRKIPKMREKGFKFLAYSTDSYILNKYYSI